MNALLDKHPDPADTSLVRYMASASRPLKRDPGLTPLGAFDTLQKIHRKYARQWWSIWIVCADGWANVTPNTRLNDAIHQIEEHGGAVGIVGLAVIARTFTFLKKPLKRDEEVIGDLTVRQILDKSGNAAADRLLAIRDALMTAYEAEKKQ
jgi:hypothetical protein